MSKAFTIPTVFTAVNKFASPMAGMKGAMNEFVSRAETGMARMERAVRRVFSPLTRLRNAMNSIGFYVGIYTFIRWVRRAYDTLADFEQAQVSISAVTKRSINENKAYADQARLLAVRYGFAAKEVSALQLELEKLGGLDVLKITQPVILGAKALGLEPDKFGALVGAIIKSFPELESSDASRLVDQLVTIADETAVAGGDFDVFLRTSMGAAREAKVPFSQLLALMGVLKNEAIQMASGGTGAKNMFIDSQILMGGKKSWQEILAIAIKSDRVLKKIRDFHGRRTAVPGISAARSAEQIKEFQTLLESDAIIGASQRRFEISMNSIHGRASLLSTAWDEFILSVDSGNGRIGTAIKNLFDLGRVILYTASGSDASKDALSQFSSQIKETAQSFLTIMSTIWSFIKLMIFVKLTLFAVRTVMLALTAAQWLWNFSLLVSRGYILTYFRGIGTLMKSLLVYNVLTRQLAIGQTLLNFAMYASPLIIFAIGALAVVGVMKLMGGWLDRLSSGFNILSDSALSANNSMNTFFSDQADMARYDELFRKLNPDIAKTIDEQDRRNAIYAKTMAGTPLAQRVEAQVSKTEMEKLFPRGVGSEEGGGSFRETRDSIMTIVIDDKGKNVSDIKTTGDLKPKTSSTFEFN